MSLSQIDNKTNRSGFDLSTKVCYTSKIGELLPIYCSEVLPGDKFQISPKALQELNLLIHLLIHAYVSIMTFISFLHLNYGSISKSSLHN